MLNCKKIFSCAFFLVSIFLLGLLPVFNGRSTAAQSNTVEEKDAWPLIVKKDLNVAIIGAYGEYRQNHRYHLAIDINSRKGESVINNADGILLECIKIYNKAGWRIVIGDPVTLEGREFSHVEPVRKIAELKPGKSLIKKGELIGHIADYNNDGDLWNDHLHYAYVRILKMVNKEGNADNVIEGIANPLDRLEITPEIGKVLRDAPPQFVEPVFFIPDEGRRGGFENGPIFGNVDIVVHAFDRMGRCPALGKYAPAPYEFEWRIIKPPGFEKCGGKLLLDGRIPLIRGPFISNYIENESWLGDFQLVVTNGMNENGYWFTDESKSKPGTNARTPGDARFPDGAYTIEVIVREHPALGVPQRESRVTAVTRIDNFPG